MQVKIKTPVFPPRGRLPGQVRPKRITRLAALSDIPTDCLKQESSTRGNVAAYAFWVTDGRVEVTSVDGDPFHQIEQVQLLDATWAMYVTLVKIGDVCISHPMVWVAYAGTVIAKKMLETELLPMFRCMSMNTPIMILRNWSSYGGISNFAPGEVAWASEWPGRVDPNFLAWDLWSRDVAGPKPST